MRLPAVGSILLSVGMALAAVGTALAAGELAVQPTRLEMRLGAGSTRLTLVNTGDQSMPVQVRVFRWDQADGEDHLREAPEMSASPAIVRVPAKGQQLVRIVAAGPAPTGRDGSYRVVVNQLPEDGGEPGKIQMLMRLVLPLFREATGSSAPQLVCAREITGSVSQLRCENRGGQAAQLGATRLAAADGRSVVLNEGLMGYVLPGSFRRWKLSAAATAVAGAGSRLETKLNGQDASLPLVGP